MKDAVFIGATGQNVGKSTTCLGVISGLKKRFSTVGFMKPVGQRHVQVDGGRHVDKDVALFKETFDLPSDYTDMSPVLIPKGYTRKYLDGEVDEGSLIQSIVDSFEKVQSQSAFTVVEGTGHIGVGSICGVNNAKVASILGLEMIIIASGGLGSAYDELAINIAMCEKYNVPVRGIILNKVIDRKLPMIQEYFPKALEKWGIPLVGCIPFQKELSQPTMFDYENLFRTQLLSGEKYRFRRFEEQKIGARSVEAFMETLGDNQLIITPASREDLILAALQQTEKMDLGLILTGGRSPSREILTIIKELEVPVLYASLSSYKALERITSFVSKIRQEDDFKVRSAINLVEKHVDFERVLSTVCTE